MKCGAAEVSTVHYNHDIIEGESTLEFEQPHAIKLTNAPKIVFAIPCGTKQHVLRYTCDKTQGGCGSEWADVPTYKTPTLIPIQFLMNYHSLQMPLNVATILLVKSGLLSSEARQIMTKRAIEMGAKYIVYWDDDILVPADGLYRLYNFMEKNPKVGMVASVCTTRHAEFTEPVIYKTHGEGAYWEFECGEGAVPEQIFAAGAGFTMARISAIVDVIAKLKADNGGTEVPIWADEKALIITKDKPGVDQINQFWGHDIRFCKLLQESGYPIYVHGAVLCGHLDVRTGQIYTLPDDAPGYQKVKDRLAKSKENSQGSIGIQIPHTSLGVETRTSSH